MAIKFSYIINKSDWIKLSILLIVGAVSISVLFMEYQKTVDEYERVIQRADSIQ